MPIFMLLAPLALGFVPDAIHAARLAGRVELQAAGENLRSEEARNAIVYFKPKQAATVREIPMTTRLRRP